MQLAQIISYWNNLDNESKKFVIRTVEPNMKQKYIEDFANMTFDEIENYGYAKLIIKAVENDILSTSF